MGDESDDMGVGTKKMAAPEGGDDEMKWMLLKMNP